MNEDNQDVTVELTPLFADDNALRAAYTEALSQGVSPDAVVKGWCKLAKQALQTGEFTKHSGKITNVSRRVPLNAKVYETVAFRVLENAGMITTTDKSAVPSELNDKDFENWWIFYPARLSNGRDVKVGKADAKRIFNNTIRTRGEYTRLHNATDNYKRITKPQFVKDAPRFLKNWQEWIPTETVPTATPVVQEVDADTMQKMLGVTDDNDVGATPSA
jgi:hypothetical protein